MKRLVALAALIAISAVARADDARHLSQHFMESCTHAEKSRGESRSYAERVCGCTFEAMAQNITLAEYIEIDGLARARRPLDASPAWRRVKEQVAIAQCRGRQ